MARAEILYGLLATVLTAVVSWAARELVPFLRHWLDDRMDSSAREKIERSVDAAVRAAEVMLEGKPGREKLDYVAGLIGGAYEIGEDELRAMIEAAVWRLRGGA